MAGGNASQFLDEFRKAYVSTTLLNSFNELIDEIEWSNEEPINESFKTIPFAEEVYSKHLKAADVKELALKDYTFEADEKKLRKIFESLNDNEKQFARFLFASPKLIFEVYSKKFEEGVFDLGFALYVKAEMKHLDDACLFGPYSLVDCVCNASIANSILTSIETATDDFWESLSSILCFGQTKGSDNVSSFNQAMNVMQRLAPVWSQLKASSQFINREEEAAMVRVAEDANIDRVVAAFQGKYNVIPKDYAKASAVSTGLIANFPNFNKLSNERKLQVSNYLLNNRKRFNSILSDSCKIVSDSIARDVDRIGSINFSRFGVRSIESIGYNNSNDRLKNVTAQIKSSFAKVRGGSMMQKANYIMSYFIPMVTKFKSEVMNDYGASAQHVFERLDNEMQLFGGGIYEDEPVERIVEKEVIREVPVEKIVEVQVPMKGGSELISVQQGPEMKPEQMLEEVRQAQISFNRKYEELYRELVKALNQVSFDNVYKTSINKLYPLCRVFNDIAIKKAKTSVYLSGLYGKRNRNNAYRLCLLESISTLKSSSISSFAGCVSVLERMVQLLEESQRKADEIHNKFITAPRSTSIYLIKNTEAIKIPCNLNKDDFMAFDEAINRLFMQIKNSSSESTVLSSSAELKKYLDDVGKREKIIREEFALKQQKDEHDAFTIEDASLRSLMIQTKRAYNEQMLKCMLYINNVVETYFTKKRMEEIAAKTISEAEIKRIEKAYLLFKQKKSGEKLKHDLKSLNSKIIDNDSIFNIANQMAKVLNHSRFIDFYETIYRELKIFDEDFDWAQFKRNLMQLICLNGLNIHESVRFPKIPGLKDELPKILSYDMFLQIITSQICHGDDFEGTFEGLAVYFDERLDLKEGVFRTALDRNHRHQTPHAVQGDEQIIIPREYEVTDQDVSDLINTIRSVIRGNFEETDIMKKLLKSTLTSLIQSPAKAVNSSVSVAVTWNSNLNNDLIVNSIMDSLLLNVVNIVDKYWSIKYNGNLDLPVNVAQMMKGGSAFDADAFHDLTQAKVIPEAAPFYITALNICEHYFTELNKQSNTETYAQKITVSKIAAIYPIYELFKKYGATLKTLSGPQLVTAVSVLNSIWNRTAGSNDEKLSASIDILLNELNASIFIDDQLASGMMEGDNTFARSALENIPRVLNTISEIYKSSMDGMKNVSPDEARLGYEAMMRKVYNKMKNTSDEARFTELRNLLAPTEKDDLAMHDYYKFMDFVIAPLMLLNVSYSNIFRLFDIKVLKSGNINDEQRREVVKYDLREVMINDFEDNTDAIQRFNDNNGCGCNSAEEVKKWFKDSIKNTYEVNDDTVVEILMASELEEAIHIIRRYDASGYIQRNKESLLRLNTLDQIKQTLLAAFGLGDDGIDLNDLVFDEVRYYNLIDKEIPIWDLIYNKSEYNEHDIIIALRMNRDVIDKWNRAQVKKAIANNNATGDRSTMRLWYIYEPRTWPTEPVVEYVKSNYYYRSEYIECLRRVYPNIEAHNVADYFDYAISQFASDLDQIMHLFMVYPGMSDANIHRIEDSLHNYVEAKKLLNRDDISKYRAKLSEIVIKKSDNFVSPHYTLKMIPTFSDGEVIVPFVTKWSGDDVEENRKIEELNRADVEEANQNLINREALARAKPPRTKWVSTKIDGFRDDEAISSRTGMYLNKGDTDSHVRAMVSTNGCRGGIADYVIYVLASASPTFQLPFKLADAIRRDGTLGPITKSLILSNKYAPNYSANKTPDGSKMLNINTQNIMCRSLLLSNQGIEVAALPQSTINNMVAIIPYLISYVQNRYRTTNANVTYGGTRVIDECDALINILSRFYNEISANITPISFLQSSASSSSKDHILGETVALARKSLSDISSFSVLEWANRFKFALPNITYPDFKNKDKYEFIHTFGENIFTHPIFRQNFNIIIENMGRHLWNSILARDCTGMNIGNQWQTQFIVKHENDQYVSNQPKIWNTIIDTSYPSNEFAIGETVTYNVNDIVKWRDLGYHDAVEKGDNVVYNISSETIRNVLSYIIGHNTDTIVDVSLNKTDNYGIMIPLAGGDDDYLFTMLINENEPSTPMRTMRDLYKDVGLPYRMYRTLFNGAFSFYNDEPSSFFNVAMNYFHKFNIRMSSIFNNLCFAQLLTNSVVLNNACRKIGEAISSLPDKANNSKYTVIKTYLQNACTGNEPIWNIRTDRMAYPVKEPYQIDDNLGIYDFYQAGPTANRTFRKEIMNLTMEQPLNCVLYYSAPFTSIFRLDTQVTYLNILVRFLHRTSYYDFDSDTNEPLFNMDLDEPF